MIKNLLDKYVRTAQTGVLVVALGILLAAGVTVAWSTGVWNSPDDWVTNGGVISAQKIGENFNYLYNQIQDLKNGTSDDSGSLNECQLAYRFKTGTPLEWGVIALDGESHTGAWSDIEINNFDNECRGGGCGIQMMIMCGDGLTEYSWDAGAWSVCNAGIFCSVAGYSAGYEDIEGTQTRAVSCRNSYGVAVADSNCNASTKPSISQTCYVRRQCSGGR